MNRSALAELPALSMFASCTPIRYTPCFSPCELPDPRKTCATTTDEHLPEPSVETVGHRLVRIVPTGKVVSVSRYQWPAWAPPSTCKVSPVTKVADSRYS